MDFDPQIGDLICWWTMAGGNRKEREGCVLALIPANEDVRQVVKEPRFEDLARGRQKFDYWTSKVDRYLVAVERKQKTGIVFQSERFDYYAPTVAQLRSRGRRMNDNA